MYTAAVLSPVSGLLLKWIARATLDHLTEQGYEFRTPQGVALPHHMTINLGKPDELLNAADILEMPAVLTVEELVYNDVIGICAYPVVKAAAKVGGRWEGIVSANAEPHITCCLKPGAKPKDSNRMLEVAGAHTVRVRLEEAVQLDAVVRVEL
jgi:hypothetical protein